MAVHFWFRHARRPYLAILIFIAVLLIVFSVLDLRQTALSSDLRPWRLPLPSTKHAAPDHVIDKLIEQKKDDLNHLSNDTISNIASAAAEYRVKRGRHPPPGFDAWYKFVEKHGGFRLEVAFDAIYDDLRPFWALDPKAMRHFASTFDHVLYIRQGHVSHSSGSTRMPPWADMIGQIAHDLPDMDLAMNIMDENRVILPWEKLSSLVETEQRTRRLTSHHETVSSFSNLPVANHSASDKGSEVEWQHTGLMWRLVKDACPPDSPAATAPIVTDFSGAIPHFIQYTSHLTDGYVSNWTRSKDLCYQPNLQTLHGAFIEPISMASTTDLVPIFSGWKLSVNNEIRLPAPTYWKDFSANGVYTAKVQDMTKWHQRDPGMIWRGAASGGRSKTDTWRHYHRHRFVSMVNSTSVRLAEAGSDQATRAFHLPPKDLYPLDLPTDQSLADWLADFSNVSFTDLCCFPHEGTAKCSYTDPFYSIGSDVPFDVMLRTKYLPDIDGNSFSGRYLAFLQSGSLPIKATIYDEWHDSRLVPWQHFVPMDNTYGDIYGILEYFIGHGNRPGRDDVAEMIATQGQEWSNKVLRKEDMLIYVFRLLLEYARIIDDQRDVLGYTDDLV